MTLPTSMTAIEITEFGGPDVLRPTSMAVPKPDQGEVLIKVAAAGVNRPDVAQRLGQYNPPPGASEIPGLEVAGEVVATGLATTRYKVGDAVCALVAGGGYAQYCVAPELQTLPIPSGMAPVDAAGVPETFFTVWTNVFERGALQSGESLLIHGGSSGIGTTAIQLAKTFGATVIVTVGSEDKSKACIALGADHAINYRDTDFVEAVKSQTNGRGVDVILDMVGGDYVARNLEAAAVEGRIVQIAWLGGSKIDTNFMKLMLKRLTWTGSTLRPRSIEQKAGIARALEQHVWPHLASGAIKPKLFKTFSLEQANEAHALMESSDHIGKIILTNA